MSNPMTFPELEVGQWYWFNYDGDTELSIGQCGMNGEAKGLWFCNQFFDDQLVTDITRVPSEGEWKRARAILDGAPIEVSPGMHSVYATATEIQALRTALESR